MQPDLNEELFCCIGRCLAGFPPSIGCRPLQVCRSTACKDGLLPSSWTRAAAFNKLVAVRPGHPADPAGWRIPDYHKQWVQKLRLFCDYNIQDCLRLAYYLPCLTLLLHCSLLLKPARLSHLPCCCDTYSLSVRDIIPVVRRASSTNCWLQEPQSAKFAPVGIQTAL